jgi:8-oxo-dGTP diphosphatase
VPAGSAGGSPEPAVPSAGLRIREAVRAVLLDPDDRLLLVRFEFPTATRWALPGGGIEAGETPEDALRRELAEEVGLLDPEIGPLIWTRTHIVAFIGGMFDGQHEQIHLVRTGRLTPRPRLSEEELRAEYVYELRWWTLEEIAAGGVHFVPATLAVRLAALLNDGVPAVPVDVGV